MSRTITFVKTGVSTKRMINYTPMAYNPPMAFNYMGTVAGTWTASGGNIGTNSVAPAADLAGRFDVAVDDWGACGTPGCNGYANPLSFTLSKAATDLSVYDFLEKDSLGYLYAGDIGRPTAQQRYGAQTVPDPASSLLLFGAGVAGLAAFRRRARR